MSYLFADYLLEHGGNADIVCTDWEAFTADGQCIKGITAVGSALELILFGLGKLLTALILMTIIDSGGLYRYEQVLIVLSVEHNLQTRTS